MPTTFSCLINNHNLLSSEIIEIVADSGQKRFFVHSDTLAAHSEPLRVATTGPWKEAHEKKIDLSDWDSDTVGRFLQFLYVGSYKVPKSTLYEESEAEVNEEEQEKEEAGSQDGEGTREEESESTHANVLMAHAKLYVLAQYKDVVALRRMALQRLRAALLMIDKCTLKEGSGAEIDVVELLEYIYSHTTSKEPIRELVSTFAARNVERLIIEGDMEVLLGKGGDLAIELMKKVAGRFSSGELGDLEGPIHIGKRQSLMAINAEKINKLEDKMQQLETTMRRYRG